VGKEAESATGDDLACNFRPERLCWRGLSKLAKASLANRFVF